MKPWEKYVKDSSDSQTKSTESTGPWSRYQKKPEKSLGQSALETVAEIGQAVDSYTGAPTRAAISKLQDGGDLGDAISRFGEQFGEDASKVPTGQEIAERAGIPRTSMNKGMTSYTNPRTGVTIPLKEEDAPTLSGAAGVGIEMIDPSLVLPVGAMTKAGVKGAERIAKVAKTLARGGARAVEAPVEWAGRQVLTKGMGANDEAIDHYLKNHDRLKDIVDTRSGIEAVKDRVDDTLRPLSERVGRAKEGVGSAKERRMEELMRLQDQLGEGKERLRLAEEQNLGEGAARLSGAIRRLDDDVKAGSAKAFDILDQEGVAVPTRKIKADMTAGIKALEARAMTDEQMGVVDLLKRYRDRLDKFGSEIPGGEAKRILQALDREIKGVAPGEIGRMSKPDQALGVLRRRIDEPLKQSEAYAKQMEPVARDTRLLMDTSDLASESAAARALRAARSATGQDKKALLRQLSERTGEDFLRFSDRSQLPEYQKLKGLLQRYREARKGRGVKAAQGELSQAEDALAPFKKIAPNELGQSNVQSAIANQLRDKSRNIETERMFGKLDEQMGTDFGSQLEDLRTISAFDKDFTRGSANTNFWSYVMGAGGFLMGGPIGGAGGAGIGAIIGRTLIDQFGPQTARVILDQVPQLKKMRPSEWINKLNVPPAVKQQLEKELLHTLVDRGGKAGAVGTRQMRDQGLKRVASEDEENQRAPAMRPEQRISDQEAKRRFIQGN